MEDNTTLSGAPEITWVQNIATTLPDGYIGNNGDYHDTFE